MKIPKPYLILGPILIICLGVLGYFIYSNINLNKYIVILKNTIDEYASTTKSLNKNIEELSQGLTSTKIQRDNFEQQYHEEKDKIDSFNSQISNIQSSVGDLEKLNKIDSELLKKYSKIYFLNENYIPATLTKIPSEYTYNTQKEYSFHAQVFPFLEQLLSFASSSNIDMKVISAYRSFSTQGELKSTYTIVYGSGANQFSADQGYSEHQLGTTLDFTTSKVGASFVGFDKTEAYKWLSNNAHKYGFVLSYPKDNKYYEYEPWHWRFVGRFLAEKLHQEGESFYDIDQREINQYRISFFD